MTDFQFFERYFYNLVDKSKYPLQIIFNNKFIVVKNNDRDTFTIISEELFQVCIQNDDVLGFYVGIIDSDGLHLFEEDMEVINWFNSVMKPYWLACKLKEELNLRSKKEDKKQHKL